MFRLEFAALDGCSRVVVVVTEEPKGRWRWREEGWGQFWSRQSCGATASTCFKFRTCVSC